jgi:cytochrome c-type biogenesis protein CcmE
VARKRSPARLVIALSVAAALAVFLLYTSIAGGGTPTLLPSQLPQHHGRVSLVGTVVGPLTGDSHSGGLHFRLRDVRGSTSVPVVYTGSVPDLFKVGRNIVVDGRLEHGTFAAIPDTLLTKCPSKYTATTG